MWLRAGVYIGDRKGTLAYLPDYPTAACREVLSALPQGETLAPFGNGGQRDA